MKMTKLSTPFQPVTITLESQEELNNLYSMSCRAQQRETKPWTRNFQFELAGMGGKNLGE